MIYLKRPDGGDELKLTIDQVTREQMQIWWDQQESR